MNITLLLRTVLGRELEWEELDNNFRNIKTAIDTVEASTGTKITGEQARAIALEELNTLIGAAPGQLATLEALADAIGDDPNFVGTITSRLGQMDVAIANKINTRAGYSLISDAEINRLKDVKNFDASAYQLKQAGKDMVAVTEIARLAGVTNQDISGKADIQAKFSTDLTVRFDDEYIFGKNSAPVNGNVTLDLFDTTKPAKLGVVSMMHHRNATAAPTFVTSSKAGFPATKVVTLGGEYKPGVVNHIFFMLTELPTSAAGGVVVVVYKQAK